MKLLDPGPPGDGSYSLNGCFFTFISTFITAVQFLTDDGRTRSMNWMGWFIGLLLTIIGMMNSPLGHRGSRPG